MIGDREHDVHDNDVDSIGVLYGYGTRSELTTAGATHLAAEPADLVSLVLHARNGRPGAPHLTAAAAQCAPLGIAQRRMTRHLASIPAPAPR